ncbi:MAG TPA: beta-propeller fold lactonase family protein [Bryobacteraceae bacterium]|jgi:6-phosphogluconolactonase (cycloisomerase 2 family)|nr:beta-propeller fold lactonase family protein [Bryobacteraceae bacterium]
MNRRTFLGSIAAATALSTARSSAIRSRRRTFHVLHPSGRFLFAINDVDNYQGLPTGFVEAFAIELRSGHLALINRQALSLSSTFPRHCAVSPDGNHMVVAAYGGGTYNVLPIQADGALGRVSQIIKEIGRGADPVKQASAHPHSVVFHPSGRFLISTDFGSDRVNVFQFENGKMIRVLQKSAAAGSGPAHIAMSADGFALTVSHELRPLVTRYYFDDRTGTITEYFNG